MNLDFLMGYTWRVTERRVKDITAVFSLSNGRRELLSIEMWKIASCSGGDVSLVLDM